MRSLPTILRAPCPAEVTEEAAELCSLMVKCSGKKRKCSSLTVHRQGLMRPTQQVSAGPSIVAAAYKCFGFSKVACGDERVQY